MKAFKNSYKSIKVKFRNDFASFSFILFKSPTRNHFDGARRTQILTLSFVADLAQIAGPLIVICQVVTRDFLATG